MNELIKKVNCDEGHEIGKIQSRVSEDKYGQGN